MSGPTIQCFQLANDFPSQLVDFHFASTPSMADFPDAIAPWGHIDLLWIEFSNITHLPAALAQLQVDQLCVDNNALQTIPDPVQANQQFLIVL